MSEFVIEIGTGDGSFALALAQRGCTVHTFEPSTAMRTQAYDKLKDYPNVILVPYAIGGNDRPATLYSCDSPDANLYVQASPYEGCTVVSMNHWFVTARVGEVDKLILDCNGSEVEILAQMISHNLLNRVRCLDIQWADATSVSCATICNTLSLTHRKLCDGFQQWIRIDNGLA